MNRRVFLGALVGIPTGALAFGQTQQPPKSKLMDVPKQPELPPFTNVTQTPVREFECTVGDFFPNANGHTYRREIWEQMFLQNPNPYVVMVKEGSGEDLRLDTVAGRIVDWGFRLVVDRDDNRITKTAVWVQMQATESSRGRELVERHQAAANLRRQGIMCGLNEFLTPVGTCCFTSKETPDGIVPDDYRLKYFAISNNNAFECATPLQDSRYFRGIVALMPGGEAMNYSSSMVHHVKTL